MSNQLQITGGAKVRNLEGVITGATGILGSVPYGGPNGVATLDSAGKVPVSQLPNSVMEFKGTWNAATNTPTLANGTGNAGDVYLCNVAGTVNFGAGPIAFAVGDYVVYSGSTWERSSGATGTVTSVAASITGNSIGLTGSPITTSGTLAFAFAGTSGQYINGAGNLVTFPTLSGYVPYTGATSDVDLGAFKLNAQSLHAKGTAGAGHLGLKHQSVSATATANESSLFADVNGDMAWKNDSLYLLTLNSHLNTADRTYTLPNASGTIALTSDIPSLANYVTLNGTQTITGDKTFSGTSNFDFTYFNNGAEFLQTTYFDKGFWLVKNGLPTTFTALQTTIYSESTSNNIVFRDNASKAKFIFNNSTQTYTFPAATGTIALTSDIPSLAGYVPYTGATTNVNLGAYQLTATNLIANGSTGTSGMLHLKNDASQVPKGNGYTSIGASSTSILVQTYTGVSTYKSYLLNASLLTDGVNRIYTLPDASGTIALVGGSGVGTVTSVALSAPTGFSVSGSPVTSSGTLALSFASGYSLPTTASQTNWDTAYTNRITSLTTTGSSGAATLTSNVLNIPNYGLALSGYLPLTGGTLTGPLVGTIATFVASTGNRALTLTGAANAYLIDGTASTTTGQSYGPIFRAGTNSSDSSLIVADVTGSTYFSIRGDGEARLKYSLTLGNVIGTGTGAFYAGAGTFTGALNGTTATFNSGALPLALSLVSASVASDITLTDSGTTSGYVRIRGLSNNLYLYANNNQQLSLFSSGASAFSGSVTATSFIKTSGTSSQYLMADGSVSTLSNPVTGTGTTNYVPKFTATGTIGNSLIYDNGSSIGIGTTSPVTASGYTGFTVYNATTGGIIQTTNGTVDLRMQISSTTGYIGTFSNHNLIFNVNGVKATLDTSGNLGLGVTPSAWYTGANVVQVSGSALEGRSTVTQLWSNGYVDAGATGNYYINTGYASRYTQVNSQHQFWIAPLGTAGSTISFTQAMTLFATGNLAINSSTDSGYKLDVNGTGRFSGNLTTNGIFIGRTTNGQAVGFGNSIDSDLGIFVQTNNILFSNSGTSSAFSFAIGGTTRLTIASTGAATFSSTVSSTGAYTNTSDLSFIASSNIPGINLRSSGGGRLSLVTGYINANISSLLVATGTSNPTTEVLRIDHSSSALSFYGAATFSSSVTAVNMSIGIAPQTDKLFIYNPSGTNTGLTIQQDGTGDIIRVNGNSGANRFVVTQAGAATFSNNITLGNTGSSSNAVATFQNSVNGYQFGFASNTTQRFVFINGGATEIANINGATGVYTPLSDSFKKKDFELSTIGLNAIMGLKPTLFRMKTESNEIAKSLGFIAQEVKEFIPQAYVENGDFIGLSDRPIIAALVKSIQELKQELDTLKNK